MRHHEDLQTMPFREFIALLWTKGGFGPLPPPEKVKGTVKAYVNWGRWVVDCPALCGGALVVSRLEPYFLCPSCGSSENDGHWYQVVFPPAKERIEAALAKRRHEANRNWRIGETVAQLEKENKKHGLD